MRGLDIFSTFFISAVFINILFAQHLHIKRAFLFRFFVHLLFIKRRCRFQEYSDTLFLTVRLCAYPVFLKFFEILFNKSLSRISNVECISLLVLVQYYKMILIPVVDTGEMSLPKFINTDSSADSS